jgi:hypothetical protein
MNCIKMTSKRTFYKSTLKIEVLCEYPLRVDLVSGEIELPDIITNFMESNDTSLVWEVVGEEEITAKEAAIILIEHDSDPEFFSLDEDGNDVEE